MSVGTRNPLRMVGGQPFSGGGFSGLPANTGEIPHVRGGSFRACLASGALFSGTTQPAAGVGTVQLSNAGEMLLWSGAGRLNSIIPLAWMTSGLPVVFYDSAILISGGPLLTSGHCIVGRIPAVWEPSTAASGVGGIGSFTGQPLNMDVQFYSGLCVNCKSGQPGWIATWTPDSSPAIP